MDYTFPDKEELTEEEGQQKIDMLRKAIREEESEKLRASLRSYKDDVVNAKPPLTTRVINAVKEIRYYLNMIGANEAEVFELGNLYIRFGRAVKVYPVEEQDRELERLEKGWP